MKKMEIFKDYTVHDYRGFVKRNGEMFPHLDLDNVKHYTKEMIKKELKAYFTNDFKHLKNTGELLPKSYEKEGSGFKKKKGKHVLRGGGGKVKFVENKLSYAKTNYPESLIEMPNKRFHLDSSMLCNHNIIDLRYKSNDNVHPNLRKTRVTQDCSNVIQDIIKGKYDERFLKLLSLNEREIIKQWVSLSKIPLNLDKEETNNFVRDYEVLKGELLAGNDNKDLKKKLK
jgi:hypothetical protein